MLRRLALLYARKHPETCSAWQPLSREFLIKPAALPMMMTTGPRWNPHAFIATLAPIAARESIEFNAAEARTSAGEWFFAIYSYPDRRCVGSVSCLNDSGAAWQSFRVPRPGQYAAAVRYYHPKQECKFAAVRADGVDRAPARPAPTDTNGFYDTLAADKGFFFTWLSYYLHPLLFWKERVPPGWLDREFLPVGNPETTFRYGMIAKGQRLRCVVSAAVRKTCDVYVALYSWQSFPILWYEVTEESGPAGSACPADGFYLVRIQPKRPPNPAPDRQNAEVLVSLDPSQHRTVSNSFWPHRTATRR